MKDQELQAQQRDVQRLLGRCLLRLRQYERLMKAVVAHHDLSGPAHALEKIRAARIDDASTKTLGTLVGQLFGSYVITAETDTGIDTTADEQEDVPYFAMRYQLTLSAEDFARIRSDLRELVLLRNNLVHHFIDQHDLWSTEGCGTARDALVAADARIDRHMKQLRGWAESMDQARHLAAECIQSDTFRDLVINGISPDGTVDWPAAGIVRALLPAALP